MLVAGTGLRSEAHARPRGLSTEMPRLRTIPTQRLCEGEGVTKVSADDLEKWAIA